MQGKAMIKTILTTACVLALLMVPGVSLGASDSERNFICQEAAKEFDNQVRLSLEARKKKLLNDTLWHGQLAAYILKTRMRWGCDPIEKKRERGEALGHGR